MLLLLLLWLLLRGRCGGRSGGKLRRRERVDGLECERGHGSCAAAATTGRVEKLAGLHTSVRLACACARVRRMRVAERVRVSVHAGRLRLLQLLR